MKAGAVPAFSFASWLKSAIKTDPLLLPRAGYFRYRSGPYRFFFYSNEGSESPHVHVQRDRKIAKFWLNPVVAESAGRFSSVELREIVRIVMEGQEMLIEAWNEFFGR